MYETNSNISHSSNQFALDSQTEWTSKLEVRERFLLCFFLHSGMFYTFIIKTFSLRIVSTIGERNSFLKTFFFYQCVITFRPTQQCSLIAPLLAIHSVLNAPHVFHMLDISYRRVAFTSGTFLLQGANDVLIVTTVSEQNYLPLNIQIICCCLVSIN